MITYNDLAKRETWQLESIIKTCEDYLKNHPGDNNCLCNVSNAKNILKKRCVK